MNVFLWILQGVLAAMFMAAGILKSTQPREKLIARHLSRRFNLRTVPV